VILHQKCRFLKNGALVFKTPEMNIYDKQHRIPMLLRYTMAWIPMGFIGIGNGILRELGYARFVDELTAHQISSITGIIFFSLYIWFLTLRWPIPSFRQAVAVGMIWLTLTIAFEFTFGHYIAGHSWAMLFHDYNILKGRLWSLVLIAIASAPCVFYKIKS